MGDRSGIEWTDATWNPTSGCHKVSPGCKNCYAERVFPRAYAKSGRKFTDVALHPERLDQPMRWKRPRRVFVDSMSDLFHPDIPFDFVDQVFAVMILAWWHKFQLLTKRPDRMREYLTQPDVHRMWNAHALKHRDRAPSFGGVTENWFGTYSRNIWLGVSVENQETADERIPVLLGTPACVRFLSCEPLLGPVDITPHLWGRGTPCADCPKDADCACGYEPRSALVDEPSLGWIIVGGESGKKARPMDVAWALGLRDQCRDAGVPFFFKQGSDTWDWPRFKDFASFPSDLQVREFPQ